ncbi:nucleoside/nucleotide kinase family protein [Terrabacter terrigena]|uniref:Uridine kinase n=1 Tax=Terrabacter terrigena TaxID=574718 RepID=A0ABW3MVT7_9MICO
MWDDVTTPPREEHVAAVVSLALGAQPRCGDVVVVAVDGPSGAGKTTLARGVELALASAGPVAVLHMDHLYPGWDGLAQAPGLLTRQVLEPLSRGEHAEYRLWSWVRDRWAGTQGVPPCRFLVVEGCGASAGPARPYAAVTVFVDADVNLRRRRGIARDGDAYGPHWQRWADQEAILFAADSTRGLADLVIDTSTL